MVREPMIAERDAASDSFQTPCGVSRVGASSLLFHLKAASGHYHLGNKIRRRTNARCI